MALAMVYMMMRKYLGLEASLRRLWHRLEFYRPYLTRVPYLDRLYYRVTFCVDLVFVPLLNLEKLKSLVRTMCNKSRCHVCRAGGRFVTSDTWSLSLQMNS